MSLYPSLRWRVNRCRDDVSQGYYIYQHGYCEETMTDFTNANSLIKGFERVKKSSGWKDGTQKACINLLKEVYSLQNDLRNDNYEQKGWTEFTICEQGRLRRIKALSVRDAAMQHALCDVVLVPALSKHLIHDNGASLKGKGLSFTRKRFEQHLLWHYARYGTGGYVLKIDFRKYFDNIRHDVLYRLMRSYVGDFPHVLSALSSVLKANRIDVSYTDEPNLINQVFSSLEYEKINKQMLTGKRFMDKSMGIGSPISQIAGIFLPNKIDTYCKTVKHIHCYDAYMDDRIIIHPSKDYLWQTLSEIKEIAAELGLFINDNKTQIIKLSHGFTFLKTKYQVTKQGKIIKRIPRDVVVRERRKLKKLARFTARGDMNIKDFVNQYSSWRGGKKKYHSHQTIYSMDNLFKELMVWITKKNMHSM